MDTNTEIDPSVEGIELIKAKMPKTYAAVQARSAEVGKVAYALVRRAFRGEPNCFWACEAGYVVGTPFADNEVTRDLAQLMVQFGATFVHVWGREAVPFKGPI